MALVIDAGPLFAFLDRRDAHHAASSQLIRNADEPLVVPSPVLVEVDYWAGQVLGNSARLALLSDIRDGNLQVEDLLPEDYDRVYEVIERYSDADIGFVDAAVLAIVERLNEPKLATLDHRHFRLLRPRHVDALRLLPD